MAEYIEREALLDYVENTCVFSGRPDRQNPKQMGARLVVQRIRCAPATDVAPVVHGRWNVYGGDDDLNLYGWCSVCKRHWHEDLIEKFNYCPNCGARMDGAE